MKQTNKLKIVLIIGMLVTISMISGCTNSDNTNETQDNDNNMNGSDNGENFTFALLDGSTGELKDYRGKIIILDLWATWCTPCQYQMIELKKAYENYSRDDLEILSINVEPGEKITDIQDFMNLYADAGYSLNWVFGNEIDNTDKYKETPTSGIPSICFFDRDGEIIYKHTGVMLYDEIPDGWQGDAALLKDKIDEFIK